VQGPCEQNEGHRQRNAERHCEPDIASGKNLSSQCGKGSRHQTNWGGPKHRNPLNETFPFTRKKGPDHPKDCVDTSRGQTRENQISPPLERKGQQGRDKCQTAIVSEKQNAYWGI